MRITLDIDDDVLQAAKERARHEKRTTGEVISELARNALTAPSHGLEEQGPKAIHGIRPFPKRGGVVSNERIDSLREDDAY